MIYSYVRYTTCIQPEFWIYFKTSHITFEKLESYREAKVVIRQEMSKRTKRSFKNEKKPSHFRQQNTWKTRKTYNQVTSFLQYTQKMCLAILSVYTVTCNSRFIITLRFKFCSLSLNVFRPLFCSLFCKENYFLQNSSDRETFARQSFQNTPKFFSLWSFT